MLPDFILQLCKPTGGSQTRLISNYVEPQVADQGLQVDLRRG